MSVLSTLTLPLNGLTLALSLGFLLITLWHDVRKELNQLFAVFLFLVILWNTGAFIAQAAALIDPESPIIGISVSVMEMGFIGSGIAIYALTTVLVKAHTRQFRWLAFASLVVIFVHRLFLVLNSTSPLITVSETQIFTYQYQTVSVVFYLIFDTVTLYLVWRYQRKIRSQGLALGIILFVIGQSLGFLNPALQAFPVSMILSSFATFIVSFAVLRREIIDPLAERISQVESMHRVSLAITSQLSLNTVLNEIASQAADWLNADGAGIFLMTGSELTLAAVHNLPQQFIGARIPAGQGVTGTVAQTCLSIHLDAYESDWKGVEDLSPYSRETFGAVICTPLVYRGDVIGVLLVVAGRHGRLFAREDVRLLELLGAQAAVAIAHSRMFAEQEQLGRQVEAARNQLETVLMSTENPVIAIDRRFKLVFANSAAKALFSIDEYAVNLPLTQVLPSVALPGNVRQMLRDLRRNRVHIYEISLGDKVYLCHLARFGLRREGGWVAVLNDVTQLKELDRLKSEMVRMTSHDLKNPLQGAMANLELLADDLANVDDPEVTQSVQTIGKQLERMNRIISGILDLERVKSGQLAIEVCSPFRLIQHTVEELRPFADDRRVLLNALVEDSPLIFMGDYDQFQRALSNLVENAIKFTPAGGKVDIAACKTENTILFSVSDTGVGIPDALQQRVFDRFFRGKQKGIEHVSGSGLGLSLVKAIVENHQGKIWLESQEGVGTTFYVSVPAFNRS